MYNTKQKEKLTDYFKKNMSRQLTINDIIEEVSGNGEAGKSTIYRQIAKMVEDGELLRMNGEDSKSAVYQYMGEGTHCREHFHLKCIECGKLIHLDCRHLEKIGKHIEEEHNFKIDTRRTVFYGMCEKCRNKASDGVDNI